MEPGSLVRSRTAIFLAGSGDGREQLVGAEGTVQADLHHADLLAVSVHVVDDFLCHVADGAHGDDDAVSVGSAVVVEELIVGAQLLVDLAHVLLDDLRAARRSTCCRPHGAGRRCRRSRGSRASCRMLGVQGVLAERVDSVHVAHFLQVLVIPHGDLLDLVGGTEAVEEVDEGNAGPRWRPDGPREPDP